LAMVALSLAAAGCYSVTALFWSIPPSFLSGAGAAGGIALINAFGSLAGFFSPYLVGALKDATKSTSPALYLIAVTMVIGAVLTLRLPARIANR
jgi:nitrate/nitrite transporter NarK